MTAADRPFGITTAADRGGYVVSVRGELDIFRVDDLDHALNAAGRDHAVARVILDLRHVTFIDGCAIQALASATRRFAESRTSFRITDAGGQVARALRITGVEAKLPLVETRDHSLPRPFGVDFLADGGAATSSSASP